MVGATGIEPVTPTMSTVGRAWTTEDKQALRDTRVAFETVQNRPKIALSCKLRTNIRRGPRLKRYSRSEGGAR